MFLRNTSASVVLDNEPMLFATTSPSVALAPAIPGTNALPWWLWNASNVAIVRTAFSGGWVAASAYSPTFLNSFALVLYGSSHDLLWEDSFATADRGVLLYQGGSVEGGPQTASGGNNTVWGTTFSTASVGPRCPESTGCLPLMPYSSGLGLEVGENDNRVFNNYFATPTTAAEPPENLYTVAPAAFAVQWNATPGDGGPPLPGFPEFAFSGPNIVGGAEQAGNYWWDYGAASNPFNGAHDPLGTLPYDEDVPGAFCVEGTCHPHLSPGGDDAPLTFPGAYFYQVTVEVRGLPSVRGGGIPSWGIVATLEGRPFPKIVAETGGPGSVGIHLPAGTYAYQPVIPGEQLTGKEGTLTVDRNESAVVRLKVSPDYGFLRLQPDGFPRNGSAWYAFVSVNQTVEELVIGDVPQYLLLVPRGEHGYSYGAFSSVGFVAEHPGEHEVDVDRAVTPLRLPFVAYTFTVVFVETGLAAGTEWKVGVRSTGSARPLASHGSSTNATVSFQLRNGSYAFQVRPPPGTF